MKNSKEPHELSKVWYYNHSKLELLSDSIRFLNTDPTNGIQYYFVIQGLSLTIV